MTIEPQRVVLADMPGDDVEQHLTALRGLIAQSNALLAEIRDKINSGIRVQVVTTL